MGREAKVFLPIEGRKHPKRKTTKKRGRYQNGEEFGAEGVMLTLGLGDALPYGHIERETEGN